MMTFLFKLYWQHRLRVAREQHAKWKARRELLEKHLAENPKLFGALTRIEEHRIKAVVAAGEEAKYLERAEHYIQGLQR